MMRIGYVSLFVLATSSIVSRAADNDVITDNEVVIKHEGGHRLLLPKDWPIEHEHGVISPVPVEQYLSLKFDQVQERFNRIDKRIEAIEDRIEQLKKNQQIINRRIRILEQCVEQIKGKEVTDGHTSQDSQAVQSEKGESP